MGGAWLEIAKQMQGQPFDAHWQEYRDFQASSPGAPAWLPDRERKSAANLEKLRLEMGLESYEALHAWSAANRAEFWQNTLGRLGIVFDDQPTSIITESIDPRQPHWLPGAKLNIAASCFTSGPDDVAIVEAREGSDEVRKLTYGELQAMAGRFAAGLLRDGFGEGDGVALYMPMNVECVAAYLGTIMAGAHVVSIPDSFAAPEIATRLRLGAAKLVVTVESFQRGGKTVPLLAKVREADPAVRCLDVAADGLGGWDDFCADAPASPVPCDPEQVANVLFSSGTTGEPKAIPWTHLTPIKAAADGYYHQDIHWGDVVAWPTNIGWMMGPWLIFASLVNKATMFLYQGVPNSSHFLEMVDKANVSMLGVVPAIVRAWIGADIQPGALPKVKTFSSTGEASNAHDYLYLMSLANYQAPIIEYCGGTEIGGGHLTGSVLQPATPARFTTPAMGLDFRVLRDDGALAAPGEMGEIFLVPPSIGLSQRLLNKDHDSVYYADVPAGPEGEVLRRHGDEVQVIGNWSWAAQGRADDTMNLGGIKVGSIELETAMNEHPAVVETAAVAVHPDGGGADQLVVFAVVTAEESDLRTGLQQLLRKRLNPLFKIHDLVIVDNLPRTASNKVMRRELRASYR